MSVYKTRRYCYHDSKLGNVYITEKFFKNFIIILIKAYECVCNMSWFILHTDFM